MVLKNKQVAIVGGGPGGLTLARLLQIRGVNVKVYERDVDKHARVQGSPLDLHDESGLAAIAEAGLLDEFKSSFLRGADRTTITNEQAEVLFSDHEAKQTDNFGHQYFRPEIDRGTLRRILLDSLKPGTVQWDSHFVSMLSTGEGSLLSFRNGTTAYADLVIAADGANSRIRPYLTDIKPSYSGITMLEGNVCDAVNKTPSVAAILRGGKIMAFGNEQDILMGQKGNGDIGFYASFRAAEDWASVAGIDFNDKGQVLDWFRDTYPDWSPVWHTLFEQAEMPFIPRPIYCMPTDQHWITNPAVTMLGDAAHVMPPFAGEGVNMAMLDALELSNCLVSSEYSTTGAAISEYETNMRKRAAIMIKESLDNGEKMHSKDALQTMLGFFKGHAVLS